MIKMSQDKTIIKGVKMLRSGPKILTDYVQDYLKVPAAVIDEK